MRFHDIARIVAIVLTVFTHSIISDTQCIDIAPAGDEGLSCIQQAQWGKCVRKWLFEWGYCQKSCGFCTIPESELECYDIPPEDSYTCVQQKQWGKCNAPWMQPHHCRLSCGKCGQGQGCTDVPPDNRYTCEQQKEFGSCSQKWLIERNFCSKTCGRCQETSAHQNEPAKISIEETNFEETPANPRSIQLTTSGFDPAITLTSTSMSIPTTAPVPAPISTSSPTLQQTIPMEQPQRISEISECSLLNLLAFVPTLAEIPSAQEAFTQAAQTGDTDFNLAYLNQAAPEGVVLIPTERILQQYLPVLSDEQLLEVVKLYNIPASLNEQTIGPYENSLQGSSVRLIRDEYVENEVGSSSATVTKIVSVQDIQECQGLDLEFWIINGLMVPPGIERPTPVQISPSPAQMVISQNPIDNIPRATNLYYDYESGNGYTSAEVPSGSFGEISDDVFQFFVEDMSDEESQAIAASQAASQTSQTFDVLDLLLAADTYLEGTDGQQTGSQQIK